MLCYPIHLSIYPSILERIRLPDADVWALTEAGTCDAARSDWVHSADGSCCGWCLEGNGDLSWWLVGTLREQIWKIGGSLVHDQWSRLWVPTSTCRYFHGKGEIHGLCGLTRRDKGDGTDVSVPRNAQLWKPCSSGCDEKDASASWRDVGTLRSCSCTLQLRRHFYHDAWRQELGEFPDWQRDLVTRTGGPILEFAESDQNGIAKSEVSGFQASKNQLFLVAPGFIWWTPWTLDSNAAGRNPWIIIFQQGGFQNWGSSKTEGFPMEKSDILRCLEIGPFISPSHAGRELWQKAMGLKGCLSENRLP